MSHLASLGIQDIEECLELEQALFERLEQELSVGFSGLSALNN